MPEFVEGAYCCLHVANSATGAGSVVGMVVSALALDATDEERHAHYDTVQRSVAALVEGETDPIAIMATVACELHHAFSYFHWTGFYRAMPGELLVIGPYQGGHGCLRIPFARGVCGAAARTRRTQRIDDVSAFPGHIACSSSTRSELVVPILDPGGRVLGVLDVDSDEPAAFREVDQIALERLCHSIAAQLV